MKQPKQLPFTPNQRVIIRIGKERIQATLTQITGKGAQTHLHYNHDQGAAVIHLQKVHSVLNSAGELIWKRHNPTREDHA